MRFRKIKWNGEKVHIEWETTSKDDTIEHRLVSQDPPEPLLPDALQAFIPEVLRIIEAEDYWSQGMRVTGLSLSYDSEGRMGCVVTCLRDLAAATAPLVLNTPHLVEPGEDDAACLSATMLALIKRAQEAAGRYIEGHRSQGDMFEDAA